MIALRLAAAALLIAGAACATPEARGSAEALRAAESAFAKSMADRDFDAFASHVADDAVFINGGQPLRGKAAVLAHWKRFFEKPAAPFAWQPELAEVAGDLGYTEGPVSAPDGRVFARFFSTWRRGASGRWLVVFDNGYPVGQK
jgi:ketosteroid isomerase-like protein